MYIKVSTGTSFAAAAEYNEAGLSPRQKKQKAGQVTYLGGFNLLADDAAGIAAEMSTVASRSRTQKPVWNVSLSAADGQHLTDGDWVAAVEQYLTQAGADSVRHQVAIWRHGDTGRDHVHALVNAVPTDGERALKRYHNGKRAKEAAQQIDVSLGQPIQKGQGVRETIAQTLSDALRNDKPTTLEELAADLKKRGIVAQIKPNAKSPGVTFQMGEHQPIKGSRLGYKYSQVMLALEANRAEYQAEIDRLRKEIDQKPAVVEIIRPNPDQQAEIDSLRIDREVAYEKRDAMRTAFLQEEKARKQAQAEREQLRQQPAKTIVREVVKTVEVIQPDPRDQTRIEQLSQQVQRNYTAFVQQKQIADRVPELSKSVTELFDLNQVLQEQFRQQQARLEQEQQRYRELSQNWRAHIEKYNDLVRRHNELKERLRAKSMPTTPTQEPQATITFRVLPGAVPMPESPSVEPKQPTTAKASLGPAWVASMNQRIRQAAKASGNFAQFDTNLKLVSLTNPPISRRQSTDGKTIIYQDKTGQATAAELGFKVGELKQLIEAPVQAQTKGRKMG